MFKLVAKVFTTNEASLRLFERCGLHRGRHHTRHGRLRGEWKDVVVLEKALGRSRRGLEAEVAQELRLVGAEHDEARVS